MKNGLSDLNNFLFAQLERLDDSELTGERLNEEINKAKAVSDIAAQIITNGSLLLRAQVEKDKSVSGKLTLPKIMED